jgi:hypothetical protein
MLDDDGAMGSTDAETEELRAKGAGREAKSGTCLGSACPICGLVSGAAHSQPLPSGRLYMSSGPILATFPEAIRTQGLSFPSRRTAPASARRR